MAKLQDSEYLRNEQYKTSNNLEARIRLHAEFSTNKQGWFPWVFEQFQRLPEKARILELGCGPGDLWLENIDRIPAGWEITLSDFSPGMVDEARRKLAGCNRLFNFEVIDAQSIPFGEARFDAVIANFCLYHIPDRPKALSEIHRVLKESGRFFAATVGDQHVKEIPELLLKFDASIEDDFGYQENPFTLENGKDQICTWFPEIEILRYPDSLRVADPVVLADYIFSTTKMSAVGKNHRADFVDFLHKAMDSSKGVIHIQKESGMFIAR